MESQNNKKYKAGIVLNESNSLTGGDQLILSIVENNEKKNPYMYIVCDYMDEEEKENFKRDMRRIINLLNEP